VTGINEKVNLMDPLPRNMADLPVDDRGYVVPWFVDWLDGKPEFRAMDRVKFMRALREKLCWVCGKRLGVYKVFVAGPMCGINRTSSEPPCHLDCAHWSARNCPFLNNPRAVRREDELTATIRDNTPGIAITRNPGVVMLWITRVYETFDDGKGRLLIQMGEPESVEWYAEGKPATRAQIQESIDSGLPSLELLARQEPGGLESLERSKKRFEKWTNAEPAAARE
jgi:hypothetical protein